MVKIGLLGCGRWGRLILRDLKQLGAHVAVLAVGDTSRARALEGKADAVVSTLDALPEVDGYVVAVPTALHAAFLRQLVPMGKPIFCEKPFTSDVSEARVLAHLAGDRIFIMDKWRYHGGVLALAALARSGELGPVLGLKTTRLGWGNPHMDVSVDWILLPHDLSIAIEILGYLPKPTAAWAETSEDGLIALSGILGLEDRSRPWMQFEIGARSPVHRRTVELRCRDGIASLSDAYDDHIALQRTVNCLAEAGASSVEMRPVATTMPLLLELTAFLEYLCHRQGPPKSSAAEGLLVVEHISRLRTLAGLGG